MLKKLIIFVIICLFIGAGVVSSAENNIEYISLDNAHEIVNCYREVSTCNHKVYFGKPTDNPLECWIYEAQLNDMGNATCVCWGSGGSGPFFSGSTWTNDGRLLCCGYDSGILYEIDLETCGATSIGGGGTGLNGIACDPISDILYGCSSYSLYKIDPNTGDQTYIGNFNTGNIMIDISFDDYGTLYGWDVKFSGESYLYEIDTDTGEATIVGGMGMTLCYAQTGDFCKVDDILYLAAYIISPYYGSYFVACDKETGECTLLGQFEGGTEINIFVIPWNYPPYTPSNPMPFSGATGVSINTGLNWTGGDPDGDSVAYDIYFGNTTPPPKVASYVYDTNYGPGVLEDCTTYYWQIVAWDYYDACSESPIWNFTTNCQPDTPIIEGPINGKPGVEYDYSFVSTDPEGDDVRYIIDWLTTGDYIVTPYYKSGEEIILPNTFPKKGKFTISAMAQDCYGAESEWGTFTVTISREKLLHYSLFFNLLDRFPFIQSLLDILGRKINEESRFFKK